MSEQPRDYYEVLGVARDADEKTIKKAYKRLVVAVSLIASFASRNSARLMVLTCEYAWR